jgi:hypothetical protein
MSDITLKRAVIYPKDIQMITGLKESACRKIISDLKKKLGKRKDEFITVDEFCHHKGISKEVVTPFLR